MSAAPHDPEADLAQVRRRRRRGALALLGIEVLVCALAWWLAPDLAARYARRMLPVGLGDKGLPTVFLGSLALVFAAEVVALGWRRSSPGRLVAGSASARADLFYALLHVTNLYFGVTVLASLGALPAAHLAGRFLRWDLLGGLPPLVGTLVLLVILDFFDYWLHRLVHEVDFLWEVHRVHHSATEFTVLTGRRVHPADDALRLVGLALPAAMLGASEVQYLAVQWIVATVDLLQHSPLPWTYGWVGRWLVYSPVGHRLHHSPEPEHQGKNLGNLIPLWDRIFGTWYDGPRVNDEVGTPGNPYNQANPIDEALDAVARSWAARPGRARP